MNFFRNKISSLISKQTGIDASEVLSKLEIPTEKGLGDLAFPCFILAKKLNKNPIKISEELSNKIKDAKVFSKIESKGPYLNFYLDKKYFITNILEKVREKKRGYGKEETKKGKTIIIEYSSPNIAKPFSIAHLRSTAIGNSLYRIYKFLGYKVVGINHLGDWGSQFGKLIYAYKQWGSAEIIKERAIEKLYNLYVKFHEEADKNAKLNDDAREITKKLEEGDETYKELWKWFKDITLVDFKRIYRYLDIEFDEYIGESFFLEKIPEILKILKDNKVSKISDDATIVDLEKHGLRTCLLKKRDDTSLYLSRDLAAAVYRFKKYKFHKMIYVVGAEQRLYFKQLFKVLELMGYDWAKDLYHVDFGLIKFSDKKLSSREGRIIFLEEVLDKAKELALKIIEGKNPNLSKKEEVSKDVSVGAIKFFDLDSKRTKDISFEWNEILNFDGETGPYLQYTHVRLSSLLAKYKGKISKEEMDFGYLDKEEEFELVKSVSLFSNIVRKAALEFEPSIISNYLIDLSKCFNRFYNKYRVLDDDKNIEKTRVFLAYATKIVLKNGLSLLGINTPERM